MNNRTNNPFSDRNNLVLTERLRAIDFAIQETVLYLDAYPDSAEALSYYHALIEEREKLIAEYETDCGPLTIYGNRDRNRWDWTLLPWPWEPEANGKKG